jgi:alpha-tubulin suppressor-like RCC1 family protein
MGSSRACARFENGQVKCWGYGGSGQLGTGDYHNLGDQPNEMGINLPPVSLGTGRTATAITAGTHHTCALLDNGDVKCWGWNVNGQLGLGDVANRGDNPNEMGDNLPRVDLGPGRTATAVSAGWWHTCAILDNGQVKCWGYNGNGQLGLGDTASRGDGPNEMGINLSAVLLGTGRTATKIAASGQHTCARLDNSQVKCWGWNGSGQLGLGDTLSRGDGLNASGQTEMNDNLPNVALGPGRTATALAGGGYVHTCARLDNGDVKCWGDNSTGALGLGDMANRGDSAGEMDGNLLRVELGTGRTATAVSAAGDNGFSCALLDNAQIKCWGYNAFGQLGQGDTLTRGDGPNEMGDHLLVVPLGTGRTATAVATGNGGFACAILENGQVKCWGGNDVGQLGQGDTVVRGDGPDANGQTEMGDNLPGVILW